MPKRSRATRPRTAAPRRVAGRRRTDAYRPAATLLALLLVALAGLGLAVDDTDRLPGANDVTLQDLCSRHGLRLASDPGRGRLELRGTGIRLAAAPGMARVAINGQTYALPRPPRVTNGVLTFPGMIEGLLPRATPPAPARIDGIVILDPGHGGSDPGAAANGLREKDVVLDVALRTSRLLRARGARVILTRERDETVSLDRRAAIANRTPGAVFVSIHLNAAPKRTCLEAAGVETFVLAGKVSESYRVGKAERRYEVNDRNGGGRLDAVAKRRAIRRLSGEARRGSLGLARAVQTRLVATLGETDRRVKEKNLHVLRENYFGPAILTEIGFVSHPATARRLRAADYRQRAAEAIVEGVAAFLNGN